MKRSPGGPEHRRFNRPWRHAPEPHRVRPACGNIGKRAHRGCRAPGRTEYVPRAQKSANLHTKGNAHRGCRAPGRTEYPSVASKSPPSAKYMKVENMSMAPASMSSMSSSRSAEPRRAVTMTCTLASLRAGAMRGMLRSRRMPEYRPKPSNNGYRGQQQQACRAAEGGHDGLHLGQPAGRAGGGARRSENRESGSAEVKISISRCAEPRRAVTMTCTLARLDAGGGKVY